MMPIRMIRATSVIAGGVIVLAVVVVMLAASVTCIALDAIRFPFAWASLRCRAFLDSLPRASSRAHARR